jgi:hypothetical protein
VSGLLVGAVDAQQPNNRESADEAEAPAITLYMNEATLESASSVQEARARAEKVRLDEQARTRAELLQIDEDARVANDELAEQSGSDWQKAQSDYIEGLYDVADLDLDAAGRNHRNAELAATKDERLAAIAEEREQRSRKIQADREARRESVLQRAAEFDADLQAQLTRRVDVLQESPSAATPSIEPPATAGRPALPESEVLPETPVELEVPPLADETEDESENDKTPPVALVASQLANTPEFDIYLSDVSYIELKKPRIRGGLIRADELIFKAFLKNRGEETFAFANNLIDASIVEGYYDMRERVHIDRTTGTYFPARGIYDIVVESDGKLEVPLIIKGPRQDRVGLWPIPLPNPFGAGLQGVQLSSGEGPVELKPEVWHTISVRLVPADADAGVWNHSAFLNIRFDWQGEIQELKGPFIY